MKKFKSLFAVMALALVFSFFFAPQEAYADDIGVTFEFRHITFPDANPQIVDGRTLVPLRAVFEFLGFDVEWDSGTNTATLTRRDDTVIIQIGRDVFTTNGQAHTLDVPAQIIGGSTMLPIRAVLESVGYWVGWDEEHSNVDIWRDRDELLSALPGTWVFAESDDFVTLYDDGTGTLSRGQDVINIFWQMNAYNNLMVSSAEFELIYFLIHELSSTTLSVEATIPDVGLFTSTLTRQQ